MKVLFATLAALLFSGATSTAGITATQPPIVYQVPGTTVVIEAISKPVTLLESGTTYLDQQFTHNCLSPDGCAVTAITEVQLKSYADTLCVYVDGTPMKPACGRSDDQLHEIHNLQGQLIGQGSHILQTGIHFTGHHRTKACPCTITYTIYDNAK